MAKKLRLILGDQLNIHHPWYEYIDSEVTYLMAEMQSEVTYVKHHIQKVVGFFAAMRNFSSQLQNVGHKVMYLKYNDPKNKPDFPELVRSILVSEQFETFEYQAPDEWRLDQAFKELGESIDIPVTMHSAHHFITDRLELRDFFKGKKTYLMESFYREMRKKTGLLMVGNQPEGDRWNYDQENRKKFPATLSPPPPYPLYNDVSEVYQDVFEYQIQTFGNIDAAHFPWPISRGQATDLLQHFCEALLPFFGTYQDAMDPRDWVLFHSRLSFAMNVKLIGPLEVCHAVEAAFHQNTQIEIAQAEGFIRQIIGWREYMRGVYWAQMPDYASKNYFNHQAQLPDWYWNAETKMACMKHAIGQSLDYAYAHHIQRLMVTGNFALLAGVHPDEVDAWYLGVYIDAIEWVEITNTRGMSQFADGGIVGTKPYNSTANYIHKMSNYCKSCHYNYQKRIGADACPFNSLYWDFYERHRDQLSNNPRIGMAYRNLDRMTSDEKAAILQQAAHWKANLNDL
jgi:deoxyribodipyrimidine photolyase-related protein